MLLSKNYKHIVLYLFFVITALYVNAATITVTSPNGGESWNSCTSKNITWTNSGTSGYYNIEYSTDNGAN